MKLNIFTGAIAVSYAFIDNEWPMGIYNLNCTGNETSIWDCQFTTLYNGRNCDQSNDASVFCMCKLLVLY